MATKVANGELPAESYRTVLEQRLQQSAANREQVEQRAIDRGRGFLDTHGELLDEVLSLMEAYEGGLARQAEFYETEDAEALLEGNDMLVEAIVPLVATLNDYGAAFMSFGPSDYPLMNSVTNILANILSGSANSATLQETLKASTRFYEQAIEQIEASDSAKSEGYESKKKALSDLILVLKDITPVETVDEIEEMVRPLKVALESRTVAEEKIFLENTSLKPTNMPFANVLINAVQGCIDEVYALDDVRQALDWYRAFAVELEEQFDMALAGHTNSLVVTEELPKTRELLDVQFEILDDLEDALHDFDPEGLEPVLERFTEFVQDFEASSQVYVEAAEVEGKLVCVKCGEANSPGEKNCQACGFVMPQLVDPSAFVKSTFEVGEGSSMNSDASDDYHMGVNTYRLFEAAYNYYEGQIEDQEFLAEIAFSRQNISKTQADVSELGAKTLTPEVEASLNPEQLQTVRDSQNMYEETRELLDDGIDEWLEGLENFEEYMESRHRPTLETGIQLIFIASQKIHKVLKLGEIANKALADLEDEEAESAMVSDDGGAIAQEEEVIMNYQETYQDGTQA